MTLDDAVGRYVTAEAALRLADGANRAAFAQHCDTNTGRSLRAWEATIAAVRAARDELEHAQSELVAAALATADQSAA